MLEFINLKNAEKAFFEAFNITPPDHKYEIFDRTKSYWSIKNPLRVLSHYTALKYSYNNHIYTDVINNKRKDKGMIYENKTHFMFKVCYSIRKTKYTYFMLLKKSNLIQDYDSFNDEFLEKL